MNDYVDIELDNLSLTIDADMTLLDEQNWYIQLQRSKPFGGGAPNDLHQFLKAAYQRVKRLERASKQDN